VTDAGGITVASTASAAPALQFNGINQFVSLSNPGDLDISGNITLEAWINPQQTSGYQDIIAHGYQYNPDAEVFLRINDGQYQVGSWTGNVTGMASAAIPESDVGQWVQLTGVYNGSQWRLYRDGVPVASSAPGAQGAVQVTGTNWAIGSSGSGTDRFFDGQIAQVRIWNTGRTAAQVVSDMATDIPANQSGLMASYQFNEGSGATAIDATGDGNNGTLGGSNPANAPTRVAGIAPGSVLTFTPPDAGTYTVTVTATDANGASGTAGSTVTAFDVAPTPSIAGIPGSSPVGSPVSLSASATDPASAVSAAGYHYLWQATNAAGQTTIAGNNLVFTGNNPVTLPRGLINGATTGLDFQVSFETTHGGVILGYENEALGTTPGNWVPALYVGTDGKLYGEILDGTLPLVSSSTVNDGMMHKVELSCAGGVQTLKLDGTVVGTLNSSLELLDMSFDELSTGWTTNWQAGTGGLDPFIGTIQSVAISNSSAAVGTWSFPGTGGSQVSFTPLDVGTDTISLLATDKNGGTGVTSTPLAVSEVAPTATIVGLPTSVVTGTPVTLSSSISSPSPVATAAGFNQVWQATSSTGTTLVGKGLSFNGNNALTLPGNLFNTTAVTINISFQTTTTAPGVLLGYQYPSTAGASVPNLPVLYVNSNGLLYAQLFETFRRTVNSSNQIIDIVQAPDPIKSTVKVNDGAVHNAELIVSGKTQTLILDGQTVGTLMGDFDPVPAATIQLGTGDTLSWAGGNGTFDPFVGTMSSVQITAGTPPAGILSFTGTSSNQVNFMAPDPGTFTVSLRAGDKNGGTGVTTASVSATSS
jgi:hypothetical protein